MLKRTVQLSGILLMVASSSFSQFERRSVTGVVTDSRGNTLPGVAVLLENTETLSIVSYMTDQDGRYHFNGLNDDIDYTLKAKYRNGWSKAKTLSKFNSSKKPRVDLVIPID